MKLFYMRSFSYSEIVHRVATLTAVALLSACQANGLAPPQAAAFQKSAAQGAFQHLTEYQVFALPTLGGNYANAAGINRRGWALGDANLASNTTEHATIWRDGVVTDLGTLGGLNSGIGYPAQVGGREFIAGNSETSSVDPLGENWGELFTCTPGGQTCKGYKHIVLGFRWQNGSMIALPTLGGNNAVALGGTNDRGEIVGYAENATKDPSCAAPQVYDYEAAIWGPKPGAIRALAPYASDAIGVGFGINDKGDVVGTSGACGFPNFSIALHAVLWRGRSVVNLGSLGGATSNSAFAINNAGQVVGISDLAGDTTAHAFLWQHGQMHDLGTLPGDVFSLAQGINERGQVVGQSCDASFNCRAFIWQHGLMTDLNELVDGSSSIYLLDASDINDRGEIAGGAYDATKGTTPGFWAIPRSQSSRSFGAYADRRVNLPESLRMRLKNRRGFHLF